MFDAIVFSQEELEAAIDNNAKSICLCDNSFSLPFSQNMFYCALGDVKAQIAMTPLQTIQNNVTFDRFTPEFMSAFAGQRITSHSSHRGSYVYEYEYEYRTSVGSRSSYSSSFVSSYRGSGKAVFVNGYGVNLI